MYVYIYVILVTADYVIGTNDNTVLLKDLYNTTNIYEPEHSKQ
jgi:hypothetical protein